VGFDRVIEVLDAEQKLGGIGRVSSTSFLDGSEQQRVPRDPLEWSGQDIIQAEPFTTLVSLAPLEEGVEPPSRPRCQRLELFECVEVLQSVAAIDAWWHA
jgi:hypothetical protein